MRAARRSVRVAAWVLRCATGIVACSNSTDTDGEFPPLAQGGIEGVVTGRDGEPLDSVNVTLVIPAELSEHYDFGLPGDLTDSNGRFSLPVAIFGGPTPLPDTVEVYVRASAWPPKYPAPPGENQTSDSVLVATALEPRGNPPPIAETSITLPFP